MILPRHGRVVLWGLAGVTGDSFKHIWRHYAHALERLGKPVLWMEDREWNRVAIRPGDLVFAVDVAVSHLGRPVPGVDYLLHNITEDHPVRDGLDPDRCVYLQVWTADCAERGEAWGPVRRWDRHSHVLYQPWGTDLMPDEFYAPIYNGESKMAAFVGSVWDGHGQGNVDAIRELRDVLERHGLEFVHRSGVDDSTNAELVRASRIAPAVTGRWQVEHEYLPCRVWKNISYGALAVTNVPTFRQLIGWEPHGGIAEIVESALALHEDDYLYLVRRQQEIVARDYTYANSLAMIERAFEEIR